MLAVSWIRWFKPLILAIQKECSLRPAQEKSYMQSCNTNAIFYQNLSKYQDIILLKSSGGMNQ
jgi:hypothetical protein